MAAFEATGERGYLEKAESIATLILRRHAAEADWRMPEHFRADWSVDRDYRGSDMFRPYRLYAGTRARMGAAGIAALGAGRAPARLAPDARKNLFAQALAQGWDAERGGLYYTVEYDGSPRVRDRLWWPICEGIGAARFSWRRSTAIGPYEGWYRRLWDFAARRLIDRRNGGWFAQLDDTLAAGRALFRRQARHLSRPPGLPDPALSGKFEPRPRHSGARRRHHSHSSRRVDVLLGRVAHFCLDRRQRFAMGMHYGDEIERPPH